MPRDLFISLLLQWPVARATNYTSVITNFALPPTTSPTIRSLAASSILTTSAKLNGYLDSDGYTSTTAIVYWGLTDGVTDVANWANTNSLGPQSVGSLTTNFAGLTQGTTYYYRYFATNGVGGSWSTNSVSFQTASSLPPAISSLSASNVLGHSAFMNGNLTSTGTAATTVFLYWGTNDGATTAVNWANTNTFGQQTVGALSTNMIGLAAETLYYYRYFATNSIGGDWGSAGTSFTTPRTLPIINTSNATAIAAVSATMNGYLASTGTSSTTVWLYWGTADGGTTAGNWSNTNSIGQPPVGMIATNITGLPYGTTHYYRYFAANTEGGAWSTTSVSFVTLPATPSVATLADSGVTTNAVIMNGSLTLVGAAPTTVTLFWGTTDGGTSLTGWANSNLFGVRSVGSLATNINGLAPGTLYYYTFYATNAFGESWGTPSALAKTLSPMATYTSTLGTVSIPDGTGGIVTSQVTVADNYIIGSGGVVVALTNFYHHYASDLKFTLVGPDNTAVAFLAIKPNYPGILASANNYAFGDMYSPIPAQGVTWPSGLYTTTNYSAAYSLNAAFVGKSALGTWKLLVQDQYGGDSGTFGGWILELNRPPLPPGGTVILLR